MPAGVGAPTRVEAVRGLENPENCESGSESSDYVDIDYFEPLNLTSSKSSWGGIESEKEQARFSASLFSVEQPQDHESSHRGPPHPNIMRNRPMEDREYLPSCS